MRLSAPAASSVIPVRTTLCPGAAAYPDGLTGGRGQDFAGLPQANGRRPPPASRGRSRQPVDCAGPFYASSTRRVLRKNDFQKLQ